MGRVKPRGVTLCRWRECTARDQERAYRLAANRATVEAPLKTLCHALATLCAFPPSTNLTIGAAVEVEHTSVGRGRRIQTALNGVVTGLRFDPRPHVGWRVRVRLTRGLGTTLTVNERSVVLLI
jgi:hypothetical protein